MAMLHILQTLQNPELVTRFQQLCGIEVNRDTCRAGSRSPSTTPGNGSTCNGSAQSVSFKQQPSPKDCLTSKEGNDSNQNGTNHTSDFILKQRLHTTNDISSESNGNSHSTQGPGNTGDEVDEEKQDYQIHNQFLYYLFCFGANLGNEVFYIFFYPFFIWNVDAWVGRRICLFWSFFMYVGQATKDVVCWPRPPSPPVVRLEKRYALEYGMPSTHAMVGAGLPFSIFFFTMGRYQVHIDPPPH